METPPSLPEEFTPYTEVARHIVDQVLAQGRDRLNEFESLQLLAAYGIPVVDSLIAKSPGSAAEMAASLGRPVALKILSSDIESKYQIGGMARYLNTPEAVRQAAEAMLVRLRNMAPAMQTEGFLIQPMEYRDGAYDITLGVRPGGHFGAVIYFGQGGTEARVINDIAYGLPPLNMHLAREIMSQTRIYELLRYITHGRVVSARSTAKSSRRTNPCCNWTVRWDLPLKSNPTIRVCGMSACGFERPGSRCRQARGVRLFFNSHRRAG